MSFHFPGPSQGILKNNGGAGITSLSALPRLHRLPPRRHMSFGLSTLGEAGETMGAVGKERAHGVAKRGVSCQGQFFDSFLVLVYC